MKTKLFPPQPSLPNTDLKCVQPNNLEEMLLSLHPSNAVTCGQFVSRVPGTVKDLEWNHMDQGHRLYIHNAYHDAARLVTGANFAYSITRWKNFPIFVQVFDVHVGPGVFYQSHSFFGLLICQQVQKMIQIDEHVVELRVDWMTVSSKWLKFLHPIFNRMMWKLQHKQDAEDYVIREQRYKLRQAGVMFKTDEPNFLNSNILSDMLIFPQQIKKISVSAIQQGRSKIEIGSVALLIERQDEIIHAWPGLCPHEGAVMHEQNICNGVASCPWHGRKFKRMSLSKDGDKMRLGNATVTRVNEELVFETESETKASLNEKPTARDFDLNQ